MTGDGTYTYQWDGEGRLISVNSGALRSFIYNALGRQAEWHGDGRVSEVLTDLAGHVVGSVNSGGGWESQRIPGGGMELAWYVNGGTTFPHYNALGSTVMNTRHDGTVTNDILFYPWGQGWAAPVNDYIQFFGSIPNWDWEIGEGVTPNRYYPNNQGRWLSPDPLAGNISNPQSLNRYAYVLNNPTTLNDPSGLSENFYSQWGPGSGNGNFTMMGGGTCVVDGVEDVNCSILGNATHGSPFAFFEAQVANTYRWVPGGQMTLPAATVCSSGACWTDPAQTLNAPAHWEQIPVDQDIVQPVALEANPVEIAIGGAVGIYLLYKNKDAIAKIMPQILHAATHIGFLNTDPNPDPRNGWRKEIRDAVKKGRVWANRMSPGMRQDAMNALLDQVEWAVPQD